MKKQDILKSIPAPDRQEDLRKRLREFGAVDSTVEIAHQIAGLRDDLRLFLSTIVELAGDDE